MEKHLLELVELWLQSNVDYHIDTPGSNHSWPCLVWEELKEEQWYKLLVHGFISRNTSIIVIHTKENK